MAIQILISAQVAKALAFHLTLAEEDQQHRSIIDAAVRYYEDRGWASVLPCVSTGIPNTDPAFAADIASRLVAVGGGDIFDVLKHCVVTYPTLAASLWPSTLVALESREDDPDTLRSIANLVTLTRPDQFQPRAADAVLDALATAPSKARPALADALFAVVSVDAASAHDFLRQKGSKLLTALADLITQKPRFRALALDIPKLHLGEIDEPSL